MFQIIDTQNHFKPVKSRFTSASKAYAWAKKNLPKGECGPWGSFGKLYRYFIQSY